MTENLSALLYLVAGVCFIMALRGLSNPETSRQGNLYGVIGMVIAIVTTLLTPHVQSYWLIIIGLIPLALRGVGYKAMSAESLLRRNLIIYGFGGIVAPFLGIKLIDIIITAMHLA